MAFRYSGTNWAGIEWRTAGGISTLGHQIETLRPGTWPTDGTVASKTHDQTNPTSDHSPDDSGIVRAIDWGGDPDWLDSIAEAIRVSHDPRVRYVIHGGAMFSSYPKGTIAPFTWRDYSGSNPHATHIHLSVVGDYWAEATDPWQLFQEAPVETYRTVLNVEPWEEGAYDWGIDEAKVVKIDDGFTDDARRVLDDGRFVALLKRYHDTMVKPVHEDLWAGQANLDLAISNLTTAVDSLADAISSHTVRISALEGAPPSTGGLSYGDTVKLEDPR